jgi:hypothetical protein
MLIRIAGNDFSVDSIDLFDLNDNSSNSMVDSESPSQLMATRLISVDSQADLFIAVRSRSPTLRRANDRR